MTSEQGPDPAVHAPPAGANAEANGPVATRPTWRRIAGIVLVSALVAAAVLALLGLWFGKYQAAQPPCSEGTYPVKAASASGSACLPVGEQPTPPWTTYEPGQTPTRVAP